MIRLVGVVGVLALFGCGPQEPASGTGGGAGGGGGSASDAFSGSWTVTGQLTTTVSAGQTMAIEVGGPLSVVKASDGNYRFELSTCSLIYVRDAQAMPVKLNAVSSTSCLVPKDVTVLYGGTMRPLTQNLRITLTASSASVVADVLTITGSGTGGFENSTTYPMTFNYTGRR